MRLLSRYLLRQLAGPFGFALAALTAFMLLNQVAKRFGALVGKGLEWSVIGEVFALSLPFIVAMTLPMAVLVAVLYAFSHLAADNEITAMRASGISVGQILAPVLAWGVLMATVNFVFVDHILPRSNARLRALLMDIGRKKPTFELREQVINEIPPSQYFLRAGRIDPGTGRLRDVAIYDVGGESARRVIYADSGRMAYAPGQTDLTLRLFDGTIHQYKSDEPDLFEVTDFRVNDIRVPDVFNELERSTGEAIRGDREMSTCEMATVIRAAEWEAAQARRNRSALVRRDLRILLGLPVPPTATPPPAPGPRGYCVVVARLQDLLLPETAEAQSAAQGKPARRDTARRDTARRDTAKRDWIRRRPMSPAPAGQDTSRAATPTPSLAPAPPALGPGGERLATWSEVASAADRVRDATRRADRYAVEVHKKWTISAACISFVLIGVVMALRFPRAGMGLVIGGGFAVFSVYYIGLTAGESLADRGIVSPALAMWSPNIVLTILGVVGLVRVNRESGSTRGGDLDDLLDSFRRRLFRWRTGRRRRRQR